MPPHRLPTKKAYDTRMPFSPYCHFERKREIFFVCGQAKDVRIAASWKHRASSESEGRCFMQTALRKKTETGNEKDPSAALGMTKRGNAFFHSFSTCCGSQPRLAALGSPFRGKGLAWILPPSYGRRCPEGVEVGWGGKRYPRHKAFPNGEGKEEAASPQKRKPTPPRCARQPLPREGARVDTPSFLWKEVPRRGGGWMGIPLSPTQNLPRMGKVASGASRIGF